MSAPVSAPDPRCVPQLYWDTVDNHTPGWWLRYHDAFGNELGVAIDGLADASIETLAYFIDRVPVGADRADLADVAIRVYRHDDVCGHIYTDSDGRVSAWKAL